MLFPFLFSVKSTQIRFWPHYPWKLILSKSSGIFILPNPVINEPSPFYLSIIFDGVSCLLLLESASFLILQNTRLGVFLLPYGLLLFSLLCLFHFFPLTLKVEILRDQSSFSFLSYLYLTLMVLFNIIALNIIYIFTPKFISESLNSFPNSRLKLLTYLS